MDYKYFKINARASSQNRRVGNILPQFGFFLHLLKIQDKFLYKILMLTYNLYYNIARLYFFELINRKKAM